MQIVSVGCAHPPHYYSQSALLSKLQDLWGANDRDKMKLQRFFEATTVEGRYVSMTEDEFQQVQHFGHTNDIYIRVGTEVAELAIAQALEKSGLQAKDVDALFFSSVTGIAVPTIDARLIDKLGFKDDVKRYPLFGLGCVAGAAGTARVNDYLLGHKTEVALLVCLELCSLTFQKSDYAVPNLVGIGLFGDGCAAMLAVGDEHKAAVTALGPKVLASKSRKYPNSERTMGWDISNTGFKIVLSSGVPDIVKQYIPDDVDSFLAAEGLQRKDISSWVCHPGGPKVIDAMIESLGLQEYDLALTRKSLREVGNMSSASVLFVLAETMSQRRPKPKEKGILMAMGPGFVSELVLIQW